MLSFFGEKLEPVGGTKPDDRPKDFVWEREWRCPYINGLLSFSENDVCMGLCPHEEIPEFEGRFSGVEFVDPQRNMESYAAKLDSARDRLQLSQSVV